MRHEHKDASRERVADVQEELTHARQYERDAASTSYEHARRVWSQRRLRAIRTVQEERDRQLTVVRDGHGVQTASEATADTHDEDEVLAALLPRLLRCAVRNRGYGEGVTLQDGEWAWRGGREAEEHVLSRGPAEKDVSACGDTECVVREHLDRRGGLNRGAEVCEEGCAKRASHAIEAPDNEARPDVETKAVKKIRKEARQLWLVDAPRISSMVVREHDIDPGAK